jgi:hypothetical protein
MGLVMSRRHHHRPDRPTRERSAASALLSVFDGRRCVGHVLGRGRAGFEAFNSKDISLGLFESRRAAIDAINEAAS